MASTQHHTNTQPCCNNSMGQTVHFPTKKSHLLGPFLLADGTRCKAHYEVVVHSHTDSSRLDKKRMDQRDLKPYFRCARPVPGPPPTHSGFKKSAFGWVGMLSLGVVGQKHGFRTRVRSGCNFKRPLMTTSWVFPPTPSTILFSHAPQV